MAQGEERDAGDGVRREQHRPLPPDPVPAAGSRHAGLLREADAMPRLRTIVASLAVVSGLAGAVWAADEPVRDIAPTGALRVAVAVGPAASTFWATRDASGQARGVTVDSPRPRPQNC